MICPKCGKKDIVKREDGSYFCRKCKNIIIPIEDDEEFEDEFEELMGDVKKETTDVIVEQVQWALTFAFGMIIYGMITTFIIAPVSLVFGEMWGNLIGLGVLLLLIFIFLMVKVYMDKRDKKKEKLRTFQEKRQKE